MQDCAGEVNALSSEITDIDQMLNDLHDALNGTMTPGRERELLDRLDFDANTDDNGADAHESAGPPPDSWEARSAAAVAQVNSAWEDVARSSPVLDKNDGPDDFERRMNPDNYKAACAAYEQAVVTAGAVIGERADKLIEERIAAAGPIDDITIKEVLAADRAHDRSDPESVAALDALRERFRNQIEQHSQIRIQAYRDAIAEVRPLGGAQPVLGGKRPYRPLVEQLHRVSDDLPADWVNRINEEAPPLNLKMDRKGRAHYNATENLIKGDATDATMYHEFGHRLEYQIPQISVATNEFLRRRTTREDGSREPERSYARSEKIRKGGFVHGYVGKSYPPPATEVFSVGMESIFSGNFGGLTGARSNNFDNSPADLEHRNLMLGLFATANRSEQTHTDTTAHNLAVHVR
ncbi:hypothetical protein UG54_00845 [Gordonia sihwensis]|nr:hypothetical protein UG54_00845 [Gordonia sihwensis]